MSSSLQVRRLLVTDASAYYLLRRRSIEEVTHSIEPAVFREIEAGPNGIAARMAGYTAGGTTVWGAYADEALVGAAALSRRYHTVQGGYGILWGVFVLPRYRGTPASRLLLDAIAGACEPDRSLRQLVSLCTADNATGLQFLHRYGFAPMPGVPGDLFDEDWPNALCLRRVL